MSARASRLFALGGAQRLDALDQRREVGELARQPDIGLRIRAGGQRVLDLRMAGEQLVEAGIGQHDDHKVRR